MFRKFLARSMRWKIRAAALSLGLVVTAGCSERGENARQSSTSLEQTAPDGGSPLALETPFLERRIHLARLGIDRWHERGLRGQGVRIAVLDSGFRDYQSFLGKGLPSRVRVRSFRRDENLEARDSQHGIFCGEVLHSIAPDAELMLVNWEPDSPYAFLNAVRWAKSEGARIISCSLIMPSWSDGEGGGEVHRRLQDLLGDGTSPGDLLCCASAGNTAERHWCGTLAPNHEGWHCWQSNATDNLLKPWGADRIAVELYGPTKSAYEISVYQRSGDLVGKSSLYLDAGHTYGRAVVRFEPTPGMVYFVRVRCLETGPDPHDTFHLVVLGGSLEYTTSRGSIPFPGDGASVVTVGAVDAQRHRLSYSSCGPNSLVPKPDFVATVPFPSLCRKRPFAGTSAAAPQAAGLAATLWSRYPDWTAHQLRQAMRECALDLGPPGHDFDTGYGLVRLPAP